jgi:hypothetical protein
MPRRLNHQADAAVAAPRLEHYPDLDGDSITVALAANAAKKRVVLIFGRRTTNLALTPDEADTLAQWLIDTATMTRGVRT